MTITYNTRKGTLIERGGGRMASNSNLSMLPESCCIYIYIHALYQKESGSKIRNKWYRIPTSSDLLPGNGKFLNPVFNGPPNGLSLCASVVSGSRIYVLGGVENINNQLNKYNRRHDFLSNKVYYRDFDNPDLDESAWEQGPSMIRARAGHRALVSDGKIYVFGSPVRKWEGDDLLSFLKYWNTFAECLDLAEVKTPTAAAALWEPLPELSYTEDVSGYAISHHQNTKHILLSCHRSDRLLMYNTEKSMFSRRHNLPGCYHEVTFMNDVMYGAERSSSGPDCIYAFDYKPELMGLGTNENLERPLLILQGHVLPSGLVPLGQDTLCVLTGEEITTSANTHLFKISYSTYNMSATRIPKPRIGDRYDDGCPGALVVTSKLLSTASYYLKDVISVEGFLLV